MQVGEAKELLKEFEYQDWTINVIGVTSQYHGNLQYYRDALDSRNGKRLPQLTLNEPVNFGALHGAEQLIFYVTHLIVWAEVHEVGEFVRFRGQPIYSPHTEWGNEQLQMMMRRAAKKPIPPTFSFDRGAYVPWDQKRRFTETRVA